MKTFILVEIFSQDPFVASGDWHQIMYMLLPLRKNFKICPNIFLMKLKIFFHGTMYSVYTWINTYQGILHHRSYILFLQCTSQLHTLLISIYIYVYTWTFIQGNILLAIRGIEPTNLRQPTYSRYEESNLWTWDYQLNTLPLHYRVNWILVLIYTL